MPKTPVWKERMPEFLGAIVGAETERYIQLACEDIKASVVASYPNTPTSRKAPMTEIRRAIRGRFPAQETNDTSAPFPYFFTDTGKGNVKRWEHLAIKYLTEEWNLKPVEAVEPDVKPEVVGSEVVESEVVESEVVESEVVESEVVESGILSQVDLTTDEREAVKAATKGTDIREWVKQAILQRANAINRKNEFLGEDLSEVPSLVLMEEKKYRSSSTAARELVSRAARVVKQWNLDHPEQKWCITNKILGELTGVTVKAVAKAVEGMGLSEYNQGQGVEPLTNRFTKTAVGNPRDVMSLAKVSGAEGTEVNYVG